MKSAIRCPECGSITARTAVSTRYGYDERRSCPSCGCLFDISIDDVLDTGLTPFNCRIIEHGAGRMAEVRQYYIHHNPEMKERAYDPEVYGFICDYWNFVRWNEHGNECSYQELAEDGGFGELVNNLTEEIDENVQEYLNESGCREFIRRRAAIQNRYAVPTGEHDRKRKHRRFHQ